MKMRNKLFRDSGLVHLTLLVFLVSSTFGPLSSAWAYDYPPDYSAQYQQYVPSTTASPPNTTTTVPPPPGTTTNTSTPPTTYSLTTGTAGGTAYSMYANSAYPDLTGMMTSGSINPTTSTPLTTSTNTATLPTPTATGTSIPLDAMISYTFASPPLTPPNFAMIMPTPDSIPPSPTVSVPTTQPTPVVTTVTSPTSFDLLTFRNPMDTVLNGNLYPLTPETSVASAQNMAAMAMMQQTQGTSTTTTVPVMPQMQVTSTNAATDATGVNSPQNAIARNLTDALAQLYQFISSADFRNPQSNPQSLANVQALLRNFFDTLGVLSSGVPSFNPGPILAALMPLRYFLDSVSASDTSGILSGARDALARAMEMISGSGGTTTSPEVSQVTPLPNPAAPPANAPSNSTDNMTPPAPVNQVVTVTTLPGNTDAVMPTTLNSAPAAPPANLTGPPAKTDAIVVTVAPQPDTVSNASATSLSPSAPVPEAPIPISTLLPVPAWVPVIDVRNAGEMQNFLNANEMNLTAPSGGEENVGVSRVVEITGLSGTCPANGVSTYPNDTNTCYLQIGTRVGSGTTVPPSASYLTLFRSDATELPGEIIVSQIYRYPALHNQRMLSLNGSIVEKLLLHYSNDQELVAIDFVGMSRRTGEDPPILLRLVLEEAMQNEEGEEMGERSNEVLPQPRLEEPPPLLPFAQQISELEVRSRELLAGDVNDPSWVQAVNAFLREANTLFGSLSEEGVPPGLPRVIIPVALENSTPQQILGTIESFRQRAETLIETEKALNDWEKGEHFTNSHLGDLLTNLDILRHNVDVLQRQTDEMLRQAEERGPNNQKAQEALRRSQQSLQRAQQQLTQWEDAVGPRRDLSSLVENFIALYRMRLKQERERLQAEYNTFIRPYGSIIHRIGGVLPPLFPGEDIPLPAENMPPEREELEIPSILSSPPPQPGMGSDAAAPPANPSIIPAEPQEIPAITRAQQNITNEQMQSALFSLVGNSQMVLNVASRIRNLASGINQQLDQFRYPLIDEEQIGEVRTAYASLSTQFNQLSQEAGQVGGRFFDSYERFTVQTSGLQNLANGLFWFNARDSYPEIAQALNTSGSLSGDELLGRCNRLLSALEQALIQPRLQQPQVASTGTQSDESSATLVPTVAAETANTIPPSVSTYSAPAPPAAPATAAPQIASATTLAPVTYVAPTYSVSASESAAVAAPTYVAPATVAQAQSYTPFVWSYVAPSTAFASPSYLNYPNNYSYASSYLSPLSTNYTSSVTRYPELTSLAPPLAYESAVNQIAYQNPSVAAGSVVNKIYYPTGTATVNPAVAGGNVYYSNQTK